MPRFLFIGDIVGKPGRSIVKEVVKDIRERENIDIVIANAENAAAGRGLTKALAEEILECGVDALKIDIPKGQAWSLHSDGKTKLVQLPNTS